MDALAGLSDDDASCSSDSEAEGGSGGEGGKAAVAPAAKKQKQSIDLETLKAHGYQGGPSVLFVPDKTGEGEQNWAW